MSHLRLAGHSALPPTGCQDPAACYTGVAGSRRPASSLEVPVYRCEDGDDSGGNGGDSSGVPCMTAPPLRDNNGLPQWAVGIRPVLVIGQSATH